MKRWLLLALLTILIVIAVAFRTFQVSIQNLGTGELRPSPNEKYRAGAFDFETESFWGQKQRRFEFTLEDAQSSQVIQKLETSPMDGPYFGSRSQHQVVFWNPDSTVVTFKFPNTEITMKVEPDG